MMWRNLAMELAMVIVLMSFSRLLSPVLSPMVAILCAGVMYTLIYNTRIRQGGACVLSLYTIFLSFMVYAFVLVTLFILDRWHVIVLPPSLLTKGMFIPILFLAPSVFITTVIVMMLKRRLRICVDCKLTFGDSYERGRVGAVYNNEANFQLRNLMLIFGVLSLLTWAYYIFLFTDINLNQRDSYIFTWLVVIFIVADEIYFVYRYYNFYVDLREQNEILTPAEMDEMGENIFVRYYVVCGESTFLNSDSEGLVHPDRRVIDTPFFAKLPRFRNNEAEIRNEIERLTGIKGGELRFFFSRTSQFNNNRQILRYFYFLDGEPEQYNEALGDKGEWIPLQVCKEIYMKTPSALASIYVADFTRLATIMLTEKIFDERGFRKLRLRNYRPTFTLKDVRESKLDFQDNKWLKVSMFNSDDKLFRLRRVIRKATSRSSGRFDSWTTPLI